MTILEKFQQDVLKNEQNPLFAPFNDDKLGERFPGRYEKIDFDKDSEYKRFFFDNGHNYTYVLNERTLYECEPIDEDYFIHKHIEKIIYDIVVNNSNEKTPIIYCQENEVMSRNNPIVLIRTIIDRDNRYVSVTNIFVQMDKRHNGYGKQLLGGIYSICKKFGYRLFLTEMVESFYNRMVNRGAKIIETLNVVEITNDTNLNPNKE